VTAQRVLLICAYCVVYISVLFLHRVVVNGGGYFGNVSVCMRMTRVLKAKIFEHRIFNLDETVDCMCVI